MDYFCCWIVSKALGNSALSENKTTLSLCFIILKVETSLVDSIQKLIFMFYVIIQAISNVLVNRSDQSTVRIRVS